MLSAIPWIGQDFVQFVYTPMLVLVGLLLVAVFNNFSLPTIGVINTKALRGVIPRTGNDKSKFLDVSYSFLSMFVGLVDGDGYIKATTTINGFISGSIFRYCRTKNDKTPLQCTRYWPSCIISKYQSSQIYYWTSRLVLFPLFKFHGLFFLTNRRRRQYDVAMHIIHNNIVRYNDIPSTVPTLNTLPIDALVYVTLPFFYNWIVGFTIAEGSFYIKSTGEFFFSLRQRSHHNLFEA